MPGKKYILVFLFNLLFCCGINISLHAQTIGDSSFVEFPDSSQHSKLAISGYIKDLQYVQFKNINQQWVFDNLIHNRLDVKWYPSDRWKIHVGLRNRFFYGESVSVYEQNHFLLDNPNGYFNLSEVIAQGKSYLFHSMIDRASIDYSKDKWEITAGRQRINWGLNLVWNPNDIFNAYSYFDFDYEERPGTDALRLQYYLNSTSSAELSYKPGKTANSSITAALYRFNYKNYDLQFLLGKVNADYAIGGGWSGMLGTAGFNGEVTAFAPDSALLKSAVVSGSFGINYTFSNSLYLHGAYLFNSSAKKNTFGTTNLLMENVTAKSLSPSRHSLFGEIAYQFTPLIRGDMATILNPRDGSFFLGPAFTFSLTDNIQFLSGGQLFLGNKGTLYGDYGTIIYLRLKWSF